MQALSRVVALLSITLVLSPVAAFWAPPTTGADALALATGLDVPEIEPRTATLGELVAQMDAQLGIARDPAAYDVLGTLAPELADIVADILAVQVEAMAERDAAFALVADEEIAALADTEELTPEAADVLARIDTERVRLASLKLARAIDLAVPRLEAYAATLAPAVEMPMLAAPTVDIFPVIGIDPLGVANTFPHDYVFSLDLGGNDVYDNNAGGSILFGRGFTLGDSSTFGPQIPFTGLYMGGEYEDAAESYTATVAIDVAGDDTYGVYKTPSGKGGSRDHLCTNGLLVRRIVVQGSGSGGIGQLYDLAGNDQYRGKTLAQANGHVAGVGLLVDTVGDDSFTAIRSAQGSSVLQGVGVLLNGDGSDSYRMLSPAGGIWNVDRNRCDAGERLALGTAIIQGASLFLDSAGDDSYDVDSQALGHSEAAQSVGTFVDLQGTDDYHGFPGRGNGIQLVTQTPMGGGVFKDV